MNKATNGQREQAIKAGNIRPGIGQVVTFRKAAADLVRSRAKAIAARRKEFATA